MTCYPNQWSVAISALSSLRHGVLFPAPPHAADPPAPTDGVSLIISFRLGAYRFRRYDRLEKHCILGVPRCIVQVRNTQTQALRKSEARSPKAVNMAESESRKGGMGLEKPYDLDERTAVFGENVIAKIYRG